MSDSECSEDTPPLVIHNGSLFISAGFGGDDAPRTVFPNIVTEQKDAYNYYVGDEAESKKDILTLTYPIDRGIVVNWDNMEKIWHHTFYNELKIKPKEHCVLLTECALNPKENREKLTQIMFETFNVSGMYVGIGGVFALYSSGKTTGIMVDCGYEQIQIIPVYEGYVLPHSTLKSNYGGKQCTEYLKQIIDRNVNFDIVCDMKQKCGYIAVDYEKEINKTFCDPQHIISGYLRNIDSNYYGNYTSIDIENICCKYSAYFIDEFEFIDTFKMYELPDGNTIKLGNERVKCTEILFKPLIGGIDDEEGIHRVLYKSIMKNDDEDCRKLFWNNIVLCGGTSMFPNIDKRLQKEMITLAPCYMNVNVLAPPERKYSAWIGGSIICHQLDSHCGWIENVEYHECGPSIVHRRCT